MHTLDVHEASATNPACSHHPLDFAPTRWLGCCWASRGCAIAPFGRISEDHFAHTEKLDAVALDCFDLPVGLACVFTMSV